MKSYDEIVKLSTECMHMRVSEIIKDIDYEIRIAAERGRFVADYYIPEYDDYSAAHIKKHYRAAGYIVSRPSNTIFIYWGYTGISRWFWKLLGF